MINLLIADDHQLLIDGIISALEDSPEINLSGTAKNGFEVLDALKSITVNVILMDINMPEMDGLECTKQVKSKYPKVKIIALSQYDERRFIKRMLKYGASGYMLKDSSRKELIEQEQKISKDSYLFPNLTSREKETISLLCKGYSSQEIGEKLKISFHTVETHRANLISKSGTRNVAGLVRWAFENELTD